MALFFPPGANCGLSRKTQSYTYKYINIPVLFFFFFVFFWSPDGKSSFLTLLIRLAVWDLYIHPDINIYIYINIINFKMTSKSEQLVYNGVVLEVKVVVCKYLGDILVVISVHSSSLETSSINIYTYINI